jgi:hypothetical protein
MPTFDYGNAFRHIAVPTGKRVHLIETRAGCRDRKLGIEREHDEVLYLIPPDLFERVFEERMPITHTDINLSAYAAICNRPLESSRLFVCDPAKRRSTADLFVVAARELLSLRRDQPRERLLQTAPWKADDVGIREEVEKKRPNVVERLGTPEVE